MTITPQYAAGLIDGEGTIGISHTTADTYTLRVAIGMVTKSSGILTAMKSRWGGRLDSMKPETERHAPKDRWMLESAQAAEFLEEIAPHLILKREQATVGVALNQLVTDSREARGRFHWTDEVRERCEVLKRRMHDLNARGPAPKEPKLPHGTPVAVYKWGWWWEPEESLFGPVEFEGQLPVCGRMVAGHVYATPSWSERQESSLTPTPLLQTPVASEGSKPSNTMGVARRSATGQVFLTNQIVTLCGLDPSET